MSAKPLIKRIAFVINNPGVYFRKLRYEIMCRIEKLRGIDFSKMESIRELNLPDNSWGYETSGNNYLKKIIRNMEIKPSDHIVDIGSGKGHALYILSSFPFGMLCGIELSERLCEIASKNMQVLKKTHVNIKNVDAGLFTDYKSFNYFYMYNPFQSGIMDKVILQIEKSLIENPRQVTIIYKNPLCHESIVRNNIFHKTEEFPSEYKTIHFSIYKN
ncbi:MAG: rRNA adenine N-6-methyltransferase family protein [Bacteroidota bacterium]